MNKEAKSILRFMLKAALLFSVVLVPFLLFFIVADPFKIVRGYDEFYPDPESNPVRTGLDKGYVTVENFESNVRKGRRYNAFIFGSSISIYYDAREWARLLDADSAAVSPYHFDSSNESLQEMADKVEYLDRNGHSIDYALIVLDPIIMTNEPDASSPAMAPHPHLSGSMFDRMRFGYLFFRASTNADFLKSYIPSMIYGKPLDNGRNPIFEPQPIVYDASVNQESIPLWDAEISATPKEFYESHRLLPPPENVTESPVVLTPEKMAAIERIAAIFRRQGTDYRIIVGPNRRKVCLSVRDRWKLEEAFGADHVCDFSRSMAVELEEDTLLYDNTHYRPVFSLRLMRKAYLGE